LIIVGYVYGKNVVGKQLNLLMELYIGKKVKIIKKNLDLHWFLVVYLEVNNERKISKSKKENK
jgi:hypothetical protein|tara:strand:+ start:265 stop:453 length:189 start_codon:yes stop_codon:yes gene_type:complete